MEKMQNINYDKLYDIIIVGGGPAGLTAAIYLARAKYRVLVLEKEEFGGQITITHEVVNYPGIGKISGKALTDTMYRQGEGFGAEFLMAEAVGFELDGDIKTIHTTKGDCYCFGILLATGANPRTVGFKGEEEFKGRGVAYCATCDGEFFTGKDIFVIGGGYAAAEESIFLTKFARKVTILIREEDFTCAASLADSARNHERISVITDTVVEEVSGNNSIDYIRYKNIVTGKVTEFKAETGENFGVFVFVGYAPDTDILKGIIPLDEQGYIITDKLQRTEIEGVYAAGDVCAKSLRQVVTATGDGALAATELERYAAKMQVKTGIYPKLPEVKPQKEKSGQSENKSKTAESEIFSNEMRSQLETVFERMEKKLLLKLYLDDRAVSDELKDYISELVSFTEKLELSIEQDNLKEKPCVHICNDDGSWTGLAFHGIPAGHEFTSFVIGLYNASGNGQAIDGQLKNKISDLNKNTNIKILVTLSCSMCPDLVIAAQHIAALNPKITAEIYDINHFEALKSKYNVMSVPCMIINDENVFFGKKNIEQVMEIIENI